MIVDKNSHSVMLTRQSSSRFKMRASRTPFHMLLGLSYTAFLLTVSSVDHPMVSVVTGALEDEEGGRRESSSISGGGVLRGATAASTRSRGNIMLKDIVDDDSGDHDVAPGGDDSASSFQKKSRSFFSRTKGMEEGGDAQELLKMLEEDGKWAAVTTGGDGGRMKNEEMVEDVGDDWGKFVDDVKEKMESSLDTSVLMADDEDEGGSLEEAITGQFEEEDRSETKAQFHSLEGRTSSSTITSSSALSTSSSGSTSSISSRSDTGAKASAIIDDNTNGTTSSKARNDGGGVLGVWGQLGKNENKRNVQQQSSRTNVFSPIIQQNKNIVHHQSTTNIALDGIASHSSNYTNQLYPDARGANLAIDGNTDGDSPFVTHTKMAPNNWWKVDLKGIYVIQRIVIWNRTNCCRERLSGAVVEVLNRGGTVIASYNIGDATDKVKFSFSTSAYGASWVRLRLPRNGYLSLAEVEVFGEEVTDDVLDLKIDIEDTELSASFDGAYGSNPNDGTFNQDFGGGVIVGPEEDTIKMFGNAWKAFILPTPLTIAKSTMLKFNFNSYEEAEGNAICLDEDKNEDTYGGLQKRCFAIVMNNDKNQVSKWSNVEKVEADSSGTYTVDLGRLSNDQDITVKYLAFIQDNDSSPSNGFSEFSNITIYEDPSPTSETLEWTNSGNGNGDVNRHDGRVSVSADGRTAIYGSGGNVHLIRKGSTAREKVSFDLTLISSLENIDEDGVANLEVCQGDCDDDNDCIGDLKCFIRENRKDEAIYIPGCSGVPKDQWDYCYDPNTPLPDPVAQLENISNEDGVNNLKVCQGDCDFDNHCSGDLKCFERSKGYQLVPGCEGGLTDDWDYCYDPDIIPPSTPTTWTDYYLLHTYPTTNRCPSGREMSRADCHLAGIAVGMQTKLNTLDWKKIINVSYPGIGKPCGCYIDNETTISHKIGYYASNCGSSSSSARLICKSTATPTRNADVVIRRPPAIGAGTGFGLDAKVLSSDASVLAIGATNPNKVAIFTNHRSIGVRRKKVVYGYNPAISSDGFAVGIVSRNSNSSKCKVTIHGKKGQAFVKAPATSTEFACNSMDEGITINHQTNSLQLQTKDTSYNLSCTAQNSRLLTARSDSPIACACNSGYVNSGPKGGKILEEGHSCISSLEAENIEVASNSFEFKVLKTTADDYPKTKLMKRTNDNDVEIKLTSRKLNKRNSGDMKVYTLSQLEPGTRYTVILSKTNNPTSEKLSFPAVTTCSCTDDNSDRTGRPKNVQVTQENGHVMFTFTDNSICEEAFSFTRSDHAEEFLADVSENGVTFTSDYFFIGGKDCGFTISTGVEASDELQYSKLPVGKLYMYCARAVHTSHYMDHFLDSEDIGRQLTSSDDTCAPHSIRWEASIHGKITTEPNAGSLPIEGVEVTWELLRSDSETTPIGCDGCSGNATTTEGGIFDITINLDDPFFKDKNDVDIPVKIMFSKISGDISHKFLCNEGEDDCSDDIGTVVYLKHLQFREPVHIYDDTSIPFSGKVFIADTKYLGYEGCMLSNVEVCLIQERNAGPTKTNETLVCGETNSDGTYSLPVIIGSTIDNVDLNYYDHAFRPSTESKFVDGMMIKENGYYGDNDFEDYEKTEVMVDIVGGLCNKRLGTSKVHMQIVGCDWNKNDPLFDEPDTFTQTETRGVYNSVPAHLLNIQVLDLTDSEGETISHIVNGFFQPGRPLVRTIDLRSNNATGNAMEQAEESQNVTTSKGIEKDDELRNQTAKSVESMEEEEKEGMDLVRFQYDGDLTMDVVISNDQLTCTSHDAKYKGDADSLHVLEYMSGFAVTVKPKYTIIEEQDLYCDIMDDDLKLRVVNQVGIDKHQNFDEFLEEMKVKDEAAAKLLEKCRDTGCLFDINHDEDEEGNKSGANVRELFATGRPNIVSPYTKNIIFSMQGGTADVQHKAAIVVGGYFSKGLGNSFALPTHKPIMVLRDPPGGLSYATYENVKTTIALEFSSTSTTIHDHFGMNLKKVVDVKEDLCKGGGLGAIVLACGNLIEGNHKFQLIGHENDHGGTVQQSEKTRSTQFATTWSYETSSDPWTAGAMSDVFVVPNLNVMYREVFVVNWSNEACEVEEEANGKVPVTTTINLEDVKNQPALAFFSRYHVKDVKLPELNGSAENIEAVRTSDVCDCDNQDDEFMCSFGNNEEASCGALKQQVTYLNNAITEWTEYMQPKNDFKNNTIVNWFEEVGSELMKDENDLNIDDHSSALAPPTLLSGAEEVKDMPKKTNEDETKLEETKRIQFSGGGSTFSMSLSKEKTWDNVGLSCWDGCNVEDEHEILGPGLDEVTFKSFGAGLETQFLPLNLRTHIIHESTKEETDTESTSIGFTLGDDDPRDEFVVDLYYDEKFGTIIFDTIAGRSKCPHEVGTAAVEDPELFIALYPSQNVFPDEDMVFELEMSNKGVAVNGEDTDFVLYVHQLDNSGNLEIVLDGDALVDGREFTDFPTGKTYKKTLVVQRGPRMFQYPPLDLFMESACEHKDSSIGLEPGVAKKVSQKLYNRGAGDEAVIEFLKECPKVEWAGELKRDRHFVVNTNSDDKENLPVTVFNPNHGEKAFHEMTDDRLESVILYYRELGDLQQFTDKARVEVDVDGSPESREVDYAADYANEDNYGYTTVEWALANNVPEGRYEIMVEAACDYINNAPDPINMFRSPVLTGVIDLTRPEKYGKELPLRDQVLIGEEISVIFSEPLLCQKPFTFGLKVIIEGTGYEFDREELQVVCEGRRIGFQIDLSRILGGVDELLGKNFTVELGRIGNESVSNVYDVNGNGLDPLVGNIKFEKKFGEPNLHDASSSFVLTLDDYPCSVDSTGDDIKTKVASILGLASTDRDRITLNAVTCHGTTKATAEVVISPPSSGGGRMLRKRPNVEEEEDHSVSLFYKIRDAALEVEAGTRKLSFEGEETNAVAWSFAVSRMKILPSASDMDMLKTDSNLIEEEENLLHLASLGDTGDKQNDVILQELRMGLKHEDEKMESIQKHGDEKMEAIQKHGDEKMEAMQKEMTDLVETMQKHDADEKAAMQRREDEKMEAVQKREDEKLEAMMAEMQKHNAEEMHSLQTQLAVVTLTCVIVSVAAFLKLKN